MKFRLEIFVRFFTHQLMFAIRFLDQLILMISQSHLPTEPIRCPIHVMHYCPRLPADEALQQLLLEWTMLHEQSSMVQPAIENQH